MTYFWQVFLNTSIHFQVIQNNGPELVIESATFSDTGKYICMVRNNIWLKLVDVWVTVKRTTTSTIITTTTEPPTTTTSSTTTTAGLQICMCVVYYISFTVKTNFCHLIKISKDSLNALSYVKNWGFVWGNIYFSRRMFLCW